MGGFTIDGRRGLEEGGGHGPEIEIDEGKSLEADSSASLLNDTKERATARAKCGDSSESRGVERIWA